jgi:hypothetical protein
MIHVYKNWGKKGFFGKKIEVWRKNSHEKINGINL